SSPADRRKAYQCDITYATAREFGFDFLRDRLQHRETAESQFLLLSAGSDAEEVDQPTQSVQRGLHFAVIDEADSLLIDHARIPVIISAGANRDRAPETSAFRWGAEIAPQFQEATHFTIDPAHRRLELTSAGRELVRVLPKPSTIDSLRLTYLYEYAE